MQFTRNPLSLALLSGNNAVEEFSS